jgi:DnaJ like chaperone protein
LLVTFYSDEMGLRGILVGSMIGVTLGPAGAYIGGFVGGLLEDYFDKEDSFQCPHCKVQIAPQKGFFYCHACDNLIYFQIEDLSNYSQDEYMRLFIFCFFTLLSNISNLTDKNFKIVNTFAIEQLELSDDEIKYAFDVYEKAKNINLSNSFLLKILFTFLNNNEHLTVALLHLFFQINVGESTVSTIAVYLELDSQVYQIIKNEYDYTQYYTVLNCSVSDSSETIKRKYRELLKEYHSDTLRSKGVPEVFIAIADQKTIELKQAYEKIKSLQG